MIKNNSTFLKILLSIFLVTLFFFSRLQNLTSIPVFCDEAIYIRWAQIIQSEETLRFIPQTDGKQPLFMWFNAITLKIISDPLVSGRIISVFSGFGIAILISLIAIFIVSFQDKEKNKYLFIKKNLNRHYYLFLFVFLVYCLTPFTFFFDRLALADNLLSFFGVLSLFLTLLLSKYPSLINSLLLGFFLGLAWLTKSPAIYFIILSFLTFLTINYKKIILIIYPIISSIIAFLIYNILRLGPQFHQIALRNKDYVWSITEILKHPLDPLKPHLSNALEIYIQYISWPVLILFVFGLFLFIKNIHKLEIRNYLVIFAWWLLPLIANSALAKVFTARYILFTLPPLLILISIILYSFLTKIKNNLLKIIFVFLIFIINISFIFHLSTNPFSQKLPSSETGYLQDWTSGWGIKESFDFLYQRSLVKNVIVGTEGSFGTLPNGIQIYANKIKQFTVIGQGLGFATIPDNLLNAKEFGDEVYLLINKSRFNTVSLEQGGLRLINSYDKPDQDQLLLYQLN